MHPLLHEVANVCCFLAAGAADAPDDEEESADLFKNGNLSCAAG